MALCNGLGFVVPLFVAVAMLGCELLFDAWFGRGYFAAHRWTFGYALMIAALVVRQLVDRLDAPDRGSGAAAPAIDGRGVEARGNGRRPSPPDTTRGSGSGAGEHRLLYVPLDAWPPILAAAGLATFAAEAVR